MNIVVLDGYTLNPGDLSWAPLQQLGTLTVYDRTPLQEVFNRSKSAEILISNKARVTGETIEKLSNLKYIGLLATGFDNIDVDAAHRKGIPVCNVPGYSTYSVAQLTWAFVLELSYGINRRSESVHKGDWSRQSDFSYGHQSLFELAGKTMGLVGLGAIGSVVARIAQAFGMQVIASVRNPNIHKEAGIRIVTAEDCFREADFVSLHCPLNDSTREMVNAPLLNLMKPGAFLINTSRGGLIRESDLAAALQQGLIAGAALDTLSKEPPEPENPLLHTPRCIITPHIAWATKEARERLLQGCVENIRAFLEGQPKNVVNA
jgi:glycerate dehydrogenase